MDSASPAVTRSAAQKIPRNFFRCFFLSAPDCFPLSDFGSGAAPDVMARLAP